MPISVWLKRTMRERAQDFVIAPLSEKHGAPPRAPVGLDTDYVTLRAKAARIVDVRRWASKFHGCINSRATFLHEAQGNIEHQTVLAPPELKELDPADLDRIVSGVVRLAALGGSWQPVRHANIAEPKSWLPLPARGHPTCRVALSLLQPKPA
jgi:hypothetical protein